MPLPLSHGTGGGSSGSGGSNWKVELEGYVLEKRGSDYDLDQ